jgi:microcystin-dependent protein
MKKLLVLLLLLAPMKLFAEADVCPISDGSVSIGQPSYRWANGYFMYGIQSSTITGTHYGSGANLTGMTTAQISGMTLYTPTSGLNISNWNTAYGWGNHASAGYASNANLLIVQQSTVTAGIQVPSIAQYNATALATGTINGRFAGVATDTTTIGGNLATLTTTVNSQFKVSPSTGILAGQLPDTVKVSTASILPGLLPLGTTAQFATAADTLDGQHGSYYQPLLVQGNTYYIVVATAIYAMNGGSGGGGTTWDSIPIGATMEWMSTTTIPTDWLYRDGSTISRTTFSALFSFASTNNLIGVGKPFGAGDGSTTFSLPDDRGLFKRALDNGRGLDPEANRVIGSTQTDTMQGHLHKSQGWISGSVAGYYDMVGSASVEITPIGQTTGPMSDGTNGTPRTGPETRPENVAVSYIIKYRLSTSTTTAIYDNVGTFNEKQTFSKMVTISSSTKYSDGTEQTTAFIAPSISSGLFASGNFTTASASFVGVSTITITTVMANSSVLIGVLGTAEHTAAGQAEWYAIAIDGVAQPSIRIDAPGAGSSHIIGMNYLALGLSSGTHSIALYARTGGATLTVVRSAGTPLLIWAKEIR